MATTNKGIYYPNNYSNVADVPEDMKKLAESVDTVVSNLDTNKVDKVDGKGLSTNDYTNEDKAKLDSLENYDDTEIKQDIEDIQANDAKQNEDIEDLKQINAKQDDLIQKLKDNSINVTTDEATSLQVQDASTLPAKLDVRGNQRQETREGRNRCTHVIGGLPKTYVSTPTGYTATNVHFDDEFVEKWQENGFTIKVKAKNALSRGAFTRFILDDTWNKRLAYSSFSERVEDDYNIYESYVSNTDYNLFSDKRFIIMWEDTTEQTGCDLYAIEIDLGNTVGQEMEEYGASPSLDYPSEVRAVGDNVNILPNNAVSTSHNGVNYTVNEDGSIYAVGTATSNSQVILAGQMSSTEEIMKLRKGVQYKNVGNVDIIYKDTNLDYARLQEGNILTVDENVSVGCFYLQVNSGTTVDETYYPKLVEYYEGMDESYSPYGQGSVEIKKINSNIMPIQTEKYWEYTENGIKNKANSVGKTITEFTIKKGQTIKIGFIAFTKPSENTTFTCQINDMENLSLNIARFNNFNLNQKYEFSYTAMEDVVFKYVLNGNSANETFEFQLWANLENAEDYQQYEEQSYILDIQKPMLLGDYFVKEADGWKEVHIWNKLIFTGQENWNKSGASTDEIFVATLDIENGVDGYGYSNYFRYYGYVEIGCFSVYNNGANIRFCVDSSVISDINRFKTMLADKYASGDSVYVYYKLSTPNKLACTEAQSNILDQLSELPLFAGTNNIITAESLALMQMQYIADTETYIDNRIDEKLTNINQQILNIVGGN